MFEFPTFLLPTNLGLPMHIPSALTEHVSQNLARFFCRGLVRNSPLSLLSFTLPASSVPGMLKPPPPRSLVSPQPAYCAAAHGRKEPKTALSEDTTKSAPSSREGRLET